jgi:hypothetical protein
VQARKPDGPPFAQRTPAGEQDLWLVVAVGRPARPRIAGAVVLSLVSGRTAAVVLSLVSGRTAAAAGRIEPPRCAVVGAVPGGTPWLARVVVAHTPAIGPGYTVGAVGPSGTRRWAGLAAS